MKKKLLSLLSLAITITMLVGTVVPVSAAAVVTPLFDDGIDSLSIGDAPVNYFAINSTTKEKSSSIISTSIAEVLEDPKMPSGKFIKINSNNLFADLEQQINLTGSSATTWYLEWNQYLSEGQREHTEFSNNRAQAMRFFALGNIAEGATPKYNTYKMYTGFTHFGGSKLTFNEDGANTNNRSDISKTQGKWYTFKMLLYANKGKVSADDGYYLKVFEYGTNESTAEVMQKTVSLPYKIDAIQHYAYGVDDGEGKMNAVANTKIMKVPNKEKMETALAASAQVDISELTSEKVDSETDFSIVMPNGITKYEWISNNTTYFDNCTDTAPVLKTIPALDTEMCLTLRLYVDVAYTDVYIPITIAGTGALTATRDDLNLYEKNTLLSSVQANNEYGWSGGYHIEEGNAETAKIIDGNYGKLIYAEPIDGKVLVKRYLTTPIDLDSDNTYFLSWRQKVNCTAPYSTAKILLNGAKIGVYNEEFSIGQMAYDYEDIDNNIDRDENPNCLFVKIGTMTDAIGPDVENNPVLFVKGQEYNIKARIDASSQGAEKIYLKAWEVGATEPGDYMLTFALQQIYDIRGKVTSLSFLATGVSDASYVSAITCDTIGAAQKEAYVNAEEAIQSGESDLDLLYAEYSNTLADNMWKSNILNMIKNKIGVVTGDMYFVGIDGISVSSRSNNEMTAKLFVMNNHNENKNCVLINAVYNNNNVLTSLSFSNKKVINAESKEVFEVNIPSTANDNKVVVYLWDMINLIPYKNITIIGDEILQ